MRRTGPEPADAYGHPTGGTYTLGVGTAVAGAHDPSTHGLPNGRSGSGGARAAGPRFGDHLQVLTDKFKPTAQPGHRLARGGRGGGRRGGGARLPGQGSRAPRGSGDERGRRRVGREKRRRGERKRGEKKRGREEKGGEERRREEERGEEPLVQRLHLASSSGSIGIVVIIGSSPLAFRFRT